MARDTKRKRASSQSEDEDSFVGTNNATSSIVHANLQQAFRGQASSSRASRNRASSSSNALNLATLEANRGLKAKPVQKVAGSRRTVSVAKATTKKGKERGRSRSSSPIAQTGRPKADTFTVSTVVILPFGTRPQRQSKRAKNTLGLPSLGPELINDNIPSTAERLNLQALGWACEDVSSGFEIDKNLDYGSFDLWLHEILPVAMRELDRLPPIPNPATVALLDRFLPQFVLALVHNESGRRKKKLIVFPGVTYPRGRNLYRASVDHTRKTGYQDRVLYLVSKQPLQLNTDGKVREDERSKKMRKSPSLSSLSEGEEVELSEKELLPTISRPRTRAYTKAAKIVISDDDSSGEEPEVLDNYRGGDESEFEVEAEIRATTPEAIQGDGNFGAQPFFNPPSPINLRTPSPELSISTFPNLSPLISTISQLPPSFSGPSGSSLKPSYSFTFDASLPNPY